MSSSSRADSVLRVAIAGIFGALVASGLAHAWGRVDALDYAWLAPPCPFKLLAGLPCPGCGMTRALLLLSQLRAGEAWAMNPAAPVLLLAMAWRLLRPASWRLERAPAVTAIALVVVVGAWTVRLA